MLLLLFHLHRTLAAVEELLKCNQLLLVLDQVHPGSVVLHEDLCVRLKHRLELLLEDRGGQRHEADDVVKVADIHVEKPVLRGTVKNAEVLVHEDVLVELDVLQLDVVNSHFHGSAA